MGKKWPKRPELFKPLDLNFVSGNLPEGNVIFNSCDSKFFNEYGWGLLCSSIKHGNKIHFNIHLDPNNPLFKSPESICEISPDLITISTCGFLPDELKDPDEHDLRIYLSCSRLLAVEQLLKKTSANFIILDADSLVKGKLPMPPTPMGLHYRMPNWRKYTCYFEKIAEGKLTKHKQRITLDEGSDYDANDRYIFDRHQWQILMTPTYLSNSEDSRRFVSLWINEIKNNPFLWGLVQGSGYRAWIRFLWKFWKEYGTRAHGYVLSDYGPFGDVSIPDDPEIAFEFIDFDYAKKTFYNFNHPYVLDRTRLPELKCKPINNLPNDWYLPNVNIDTEDGYKYNDTCFEDFSEEALIWDGKGINKEVSDKYKEYFNELTSGVGPPRYSFSLNTTPPRLAEEKCLRKTIESLLNQSFPPDKIFLCIPYAYKRFVDRIPTWSLPSWLKELPKVEVLRGEDHGPASRYVYVQGHDGLICSADDDVIYEKDAFEKLINFKILNKLDAACHWSYFWWDSPAPEEGGGNASLAVDTSIKYLQGVDMILFDSNILGGRVDASTISPLMNSFESFVKTCHEVYEDSFLLDDLTISYYLQYKGFKVDSISKGESTPVHEEQSTSKDEFRLTDTVGRGKRYFKTFGIIWYLKKNYPIKKLSI